MSDATELGAALELATGSRVLSMARVPGGDINEAFKVALDDGRPVFVKTRHDAAAGEYAGEAAALDWLGEPDTLAVASVVAVHDPPSSHPGPRLLALDWIEPGAAGPALDEQLGRGLAGLHNAGAAAFGATAPAGGSPVPLRLASLQLSNEPADDWGAFYAERRLRPAVTAARDRGRLSAAGARAVAQVCERIGELAGPPEPPARVHGDLWSGNVLTGADGRPRLIDPVAHGGHREMDLAMLRLFGSPSPRLLDAYQEVSPLSEGHSERVALWQLFPLLVHAALFGGGYGEAALRVARRYAG